MNKNERIIKEIEKEPAEERFPNKKPIDLKKEVSEALNELKNNFVVSELRFITDKIKETNSCYIVLNDKEISKLEKSINAIAQCQIILEKIRSKI